MALDRTWYNTLVDDSGSGLDGSIWDKADVDALMDAIDAEHALGIVLTAATPAAFTVATHDWAAGAATLQSVSATGALNLTGMVSTTPNQIRVLINVAAFTITIKHENAGSAAANRFFMAGAADILLTTNASRVFVYHAAVGRWRPVIDG